MHSLFLSCPRGLEYLLETELRELGLTVEKVSPQGVYGQASLEVAYRICLHTRLANRVHLQLIEGEVHTPKDLHRLCEQYPWESVFSVDKRIAIDFHGRSQQFRNAMFGAQVVKDGIVDRFWSRHKARPDVDKRTPDIRLHAFLKGKQVRISLDMSGYSLHQRGYRKAAGEAPLKENVAAAMLMRSQWPEKCRQDFAFCDPFCGSGTLVLEAALIAMQRAPGSLRADQAFKQWKGHDEALWQALCEDAKSQERAITVPIIGSDNDAEMIHIAEQNAARAGLAEQVQFCHEDARTQPRPETKQGIIVSNPPYGERMGELEQLQSLYQDFGQCLAKQFTNWNAYILTSSPLLARAIGLRSDKRYRIQNGALDCQLYRFCLSEKNTYNPAALGGDEEAMAALRNRLKKNWQHLSKWARRQGIEAFRIYDADLPNYAFAVDWYNGQVVVQEYVPPADIPVHKAQARVMEMRLVLSEVLGVDASMMHFKERRQQKGSSQYQKVAKKQVDALVKEGEARFKINLSDYLDTGLFLDHRPLRLEFAQLSKGTRFLNCFCYTASASVHAALAGAVTTNVDLSNTYLRWAEDNFRLNQLDPNRHQFIAFDCMEWLRLSKEQFDVIFLDPPSFSNSKRMEGTLDVQRDHMDLIYSAMRRLSKDGILYFSTNLRSFRLDEGLHKHFVIKDISAATIPEDFKRNQKIHRCFTIQQREKK